MISYEFKKGELNKFNDLNQDLKTIYSEYILDNDGRIYGTSLLQKGDHIAQTDFRMYIQCGQNRVFVFDSKSIFEAIKNNKKNIKSITINDINDIYFTGNDLNIKIGHTMIVDPEKYNIFKKINKTIISQNTIYNLCNDNNMVIELDEDDVYSLVNNEYINVSEYSYRTRITKGVIPGLKKSHTVTLCMYNHPSDKTLFYLVITVYRNSCTSFHKYTCLKI